MQSVSGGVHSKVHQKADGDVADGVMLSDSERIETLVLTIEALQVAPHGCDRQGRRVEEAKQKSCKIL